MSKTKKKNVKEAKIKEVEIKEESVKEEEMSQEFTDTKTKKEQNDKKKKIIIKIFDILLWIVLIAWMAVVVVDYNHVRKEEKPQFCLKEETIQYEDGTVELCVGFGYKVYEYKRESYAGIEFGPFWIDDRSEEETDE